MPPRALVSIGKRRFSVLIEQLTTVDGPSGAPVQVWMPLASDLMSKAGLTATERVDADQMAARFYTQWVMPYRPTMDPDAVDVPALRRLRFKGRQYDIQSAQTLGDVDVYIELVTVAASKVA